MRISDWSSDVCSSDLREGGPPGSSFSSPHRKAGWAGGSHGPATMPQEPMIELQQEQSRNSSGLMELGLNRAKVFTLPQLWPVTLTCCQDRKSVGSGKRGAVRVDQGGARHIKKKKKTQKQ